MVISNWTTFRYAYATKAVTSAVSLTYVAGAPATITRGAGSFISDGFVGGMTVDITGTASNNYRHTVSSVSALTLTLAAGDTLTAEGPVSSSLLGALRDPDGIETWPLANVRASGFSAGFTGITKPIYSVPFNVTVDAAADSPAGTDRYDWYVSQRTDSTATRYFTPSQFASGANTYSGILTLTPTAQLVSDLAPTDLGGGAYLLSIDDSIRAFNMLHIYCRRISDGAIQWLDVGRYHLSNYG